MTTEPLRFRGKRADGTAVTSVQTVYTPAELVESLFDVGWRELVVTRDGVVVGAIERSKGKRVWWAEP